MSDSEQQAQQALMAELDDAQSDAGAAADLGDAGNTEEPQRRNRPVIVAAPDAAEGDAAQGQGQQPEAAEGEGQASETGKAAGDAPGEPEAKEGGEGQPAEETPAAPSQLEQLQAQNAQLMQTINQLAAAGGAPGVLPPPQPAQSAQAPAPAPEAAGQAPPAPAPMPPGPNAGASGYRPLEVLSEAELTALGLEPGVNEAFNKLGGHIMTQVAPQIDAMQARIMESVQAMNSYNTFMSDLLTQHADLAPHRNYVDFVLSAMGNDPQAQAMDQAAMMAAVVDRVRSGLGLAQASAKPAAKGDEAQKKKAPPAMPGAGGGRGAASTPKGEKTQADFIAELV